MAEALAEKIIQAGIKASLVAYCPTMDLIALVTVDGKINVYRLSGHKVFGISSKDPLANVTQIKWKPNGKRRRPPILPPTICLTISRKAGALLLLVMSTLFP